MEHPTLPSTSAADADLAPLWWRGQWRSALKRHLRRAGVVAAAVVTVGSAASVYLSERGWRTCTADEVCREVRLYPFTVQRRSDVTTRNGVPDGLRREWHPTGALWIEGRYANGERTGTWRERWPDGAVRFEGTYVDGELTGLESWYYPDGQLEWQVPHVDGARHGVERWYHEGGALRREGRWERGVKDGVFSVYDEDGQLAFTTTYKDGENVGGADDDAVD